MESTARFVNALAAALIFCAPAIAEDQAPPADALRQAESADPSPADANKEIAKATTAAAKDPVICKSVTATGSRVRKGRVCVAKSAWATGERNAKETMRGIERTNSTGVGGQALGVEPGT
jgi:hypothetical protein